MGKITAGSVLAQVDGLLPNAYSREEKLRWLLQAEGIVRREIVQPVTGEALPLPAELEDDSLLTAQAPYDRLYALYLQGQIHYADGDAVRCGNAMSLWNRGVAELQAALLRETNRGQAAQCLRLC